MKEIRRLQYYSSGTFYLNVPMEFARRLGLKRGDYVSILLEEGRRRLLVEKLSEVERE